MKNINDFNEEHKPFYIILEREDYVLFDRWCLDNEIELVKQEHSYYMLIKNNIVYPVIGCIRHMMLNSLKGYKFKYIIYDDVEFIDDIAVIKKP